MSDLPIGRAAFVDFLLRAKRATYANQGGADTKVTPALPGSVQLAFAEGDLLYRDIYYGSVFFVGEEVVYHAGKPVWVMNYGGGVTVSDVDAGAVGRFLQEAMRHVEADRPFRGPSRYARGPYVYTDSATGDLARFFGVELIHLDERAIYELRYHGGVLVG